MCWSCSASAYIRTVRLLTVDSQGNPRSLRRLHRQDTVPIQSVKTVRVVHTPNLLLCPKGSTRRILGREADRRTTIGLANQVHKGARDQLSGWMSRLGTGRSLRRFSSAMRWKPSDSPIKWAWDGQRPHCCISRQQELIPLVI